MFSAMESDPERTDSTEDNTQLLVAKVRNERMTTTTMSSMSVNPPSRRRVSVGVRIRVALDGDEYRTFPRCEQLATAQKKHDGSPFGYTQVFRNGVVEAVECTWLERSPNFPEYIEGFLLQFTEKSLATIEQLGLGMPIYAAFTFVGVRGFNLHVGENIRLNVRRSVPLRMDVLLLPEQRFESRDVSAATILRPAFNVLGNAFGLPGSPHYDADGERIER